MSKACLRLKACPKCKGDLLINHAIEDDEEVCIQCGFRKFGRVIHNKQPENRLEKTVVVVNMQTNSKAKVKM
ncbi:hypothetical protein ACFLTG_02835 [Chloroflexota bacterium]